MTNTLKMSYKILSTHYANSSSSNPKKIAPEKIKSMQSEPITVSSYGYGPFTQIFKKGDGAYVAARTSGNRYATTLNDYSKNGYFSQIDDFGMGSWKSAGEDVKPSMFNVIPKMPNIAYITGISPLGMHFPNKRDTQVNLRVTPRIVEAVDPNKIGYFESKKANRYHDLRSSLFDDANRFQKEAVAQLEFLDKKGLSLKSTSPAIALGIEYDVGKEGYLAAYYPKKRILVAETKFYEKVKNLMSRYGVTGKEAIEAMKHSVLAYHELFKHGAFGIGDEGLQGLLDAEFYSMMAKNYKGTKWESIYKALAEEGRDYAKSHSLPGAILEEITAEPFPKGKSQLELLVAKFEAEAKALGKKGKDSADYVEERLHETYGHLLGGEPSYKAIEEYTKSENTKKEAAKSMSDAKEINENKSAKSEKAEASAE